MYANASGHSQADLRSFRKFRDQHGRGWQCNIENKTQHPTGPVSPMFKAPLMPPAKYRRIVDAAAGTLEIMYDPWITDLTQAHNAYQMSALEESVKMFGDKGPEQLEKRDPALLRRIGKAPEPIERVLAAKAGNRWVLGLKRPDGSAEPKPKWAEQFFAPPVKVAQPVFPNADEEFADSPADDEAEPEKTYPHHVGFGSYELSDGTVLPQKTPKAQALAEQAKLDASETVTVGGAPEVHASWQEG